MPPPAAASDDAEAPLLRVVFRDVPRPMLESAAAPPAHLGGFTLEARSVAVEGFEVGSKEFLALVPAGADLFVLLSQGAEKEKEEGLRQKKEKKNQNRGRKGGGGGGSKKRRRRSSLRSASFFREKDEYY